MSGGIHSRAASIAAVAGGVQVEKVDRKRLTSYLKKHGLEVGAETDEQLLAIHYRLVAKMAHAEVEGSEFADCPSCNATVAVDNAGLCHVCGAKLDDGNPAPEMTASDLDTSVRQIKAASVTSAMNYWRIGQELYRILSKRAYKTRVADGKPKYSSFKDFVEAELPFRYSQAKRMMAVHLAFDAETIARIGSSVGASKLEFFARFPESEREKALETFGSATAKQLKAEVKRMFPTPKPPMVQDQHTRRIPPGQRAPTARRRAVDEERPEDSPFVVPDPPPREERITVVVEPGEVELQLKRTRKGLVAVDLSINGIETEYVVDVEGKKLTIRKKRV